MAISYGKLSELIINAYYKTVRSNDSNYTIRHVAEMIAQEVAYFAKLNAYEQDRLGESVYSNDQFISTYVGLSMQTDDNGDKYIPLPNTPAGLPKNREVVSVAFTGNKQTQVYPMRNKDIFMQQIAGTPKWMTLYYIENGKIIFYNLSSLITGTVNLKLVGAVGQGTADDLINIDINMPKDTESLIFDKVMARLNSIRGVLVDNVNDNVSK